MLRFMPDFRFRSDGSFAGAVAIVTIWLDFVEARERRRETAHTETQSHREEML
jgi:predicted outer membrane lipoprotein